MNPESTLLKKTKETKSERKIVELTVCKSAISINIKQPVRKTISVKFANRGHLWASQL